MRLGTGYEDLFWRFLETLSHVAITMFFAIIIGVLLAVIAYKFKKIAKIIVVITNVLQTTPAFGVLVIMVPLLGTGLKPTIVAMLVVSILPIFKNTFSGLECISNNIIEASDGMGMTNFQKLYIVELPLVIPITMAGIRMSTIICVGMSVLAAYIGAGGLGFFIRFGLALRNTEVLLKGIVASSILAISLNFFLGMLEVKLKNKIGKV